MIHSYDVASFFQNFSRTNKTLDSFPSTNPLMLFSQQHFSLFILSTEVSIFLFIILFAFEVSIYSIALFVFLILFCICFVIVSTFSINLSLFCFRFAIVSSIYWQVIYVHIMISFSPSFYFIKYDLSLKTLDSLLFCSQQINIGDNPDPTPYYNYCLITNIQMYISNQSESLPEYGSSY